MLCALCNKKKSLCKSHIFPEFLYKPLYDKSHKFTGLSTDPNVRNKRLSKGMYEKLLCIECEKIIGKFENYAKIVLLGGVGGTPISLKNDADFIVCDGIDYSLFKLFQISLIWRAGVSKRSEFSKVTLGPHESRLRKMVIDENPGEPHEYGCIIVAAPSIINIIEELILPPEPLRLNGFRCFRAVLAGMFWFFFTSSHTEKFEFNQLFLSKDGRLLIYKENNKSIEFLMKFGYDLLKGGKLKSY